MTDSTMPDWTALSVVTTEDHKAMRLWGTHGWAEAQKLRSRVAELEAENTRLGELAENQGREIKRLHSLLEPQP